MRTPSGDATPISVDGACSLKQLKMVVENEMFIPAGTLPSSYSISLSVLNVCHVTASQCLVVADEVLADEEATVEEMGLASGMEISLMIEVDGGAKGDSRYKKATSRFRWKWAKKRTRRLQKKRRKMRMRAR